MVSKDFMSRAIEFGIRRRGERERKGNQESGKEERTQEMRMEGDVNFHREKK